MSTTLPIGIDLGTTLSAVGYIDEHGQSQMIVGTDGERLTPSVAFFGDDGIDVGWSAWDQATRFPERVAEHAKRDMGAQKYRHSIMGKDYPPEVIQGCILRSLRNGIVAAFGESFQAVITVPAYFDEGRRKSTADAGVMSGLPVLDIVNEPTAAALAFGERLGYLTPEGAPQEKRTLLVYDLGGGTFDVTVIELSPGNVRTLATDGDCELGGLDWDQRLAEHAIARFRALHPDAAKLARHDEVRLIRAARQAKHALSDSPLTTLEFSLQEHDLTLPVTRDEFNRLTADLVERTAFTTRQALQAANVLWDDVDHILLVGGSTRMPAIQRMLHELSGKVAEDAVDPDEAVARGAAIFARYLLGKEGIDPTVPKLRIKDVNSHGLGIEGVNRDTMRVENVILIPRNTPLPRDVRRTFVTRTDNQRSVKVELLEGDSTLPGHCSRLAVAAIRNLPPGLPRGTGIVVRYSLQSNGRLVVNAEIPGVGRPVLMELERLRGFPDKRVMHWKRVICQDGGYHDFDDAVASVLAVDCEEIADETVASIGNKDANVYRTELDLRPAVDFGAPRAASDYLQSEIANRQPAVTFDGLSAGQSLAPYHEDIAADAHRTSWKSNQRARGHRLFMNVIGHVVASLLGLVIGYYLLCYVRPDLNFLDLDLPGLPALQVHPE